MRQDGCMISHAEQDVHKHHNMSWTAPTALYKSVLQVSWSFFLCFMLALPLRVMSVLAINLLVSDDCLVSRGYSCELKRFFMFLWVNQHSATKFIYQEAVCYHNICTVSISEAFLLSWLLVQKRNPPTIPSLSVIFSFSFKPFIFFFYVLLFLPCFSFPQSSEVITVLWSCVMEPAVINLMNSAQSPPFIVPPLKCKLHCVYVEFGCTFAQYKLRNYPDHVCVLREMSSVGFRNSFLCSRNLAFNIRWYSIWIFIGFIWHYDIAGLGDI